ncbi:8887_t:CDS:2 [Cetraspora pellucida]|uniref:8887_t:CDS:1 n=1 Tax=Cetraspora pellucida TaxID=1433469 RepID=A0A9N9G0N6_9GLOM|nr:8887_t:CDS:2 [Cetraspora pellucida]
MPRNYNTWAKAYQAFLNSSAISFYLKSIISNIDLLYRCSEETALNCELCKSAKNNLILTKACHIDHLVSGYDVVDQYNFLDNDNLDALNASENFTIFDSAAIIQSGLKDIKMKNIDLLETFASGLIEEQKRAYFLICDHHRKNQKMFKSILSQLLLYLGDAGGTVKFRVIKAVIAYFDYVSLCHTLLVLAPTRIAVANVYGSTIHSACGFGFNKNGKKSATLAKETLQQLQDVEYVILDESNDNSAPFAEINIMFVSDFMQLPPVLDPALYLPNNITLVSSNNYQAKTANI